MSFIGFIAKSFALSIPTFIRLAPVLLVFSLLTVGVFAASEDPLVHKIAAFILGTLGWSFLYLMGLRAGLNALKVTSPAHLDGVINNTAKLTFIHMLVQLLLILVVTGMVYVLITRVMLSPDIAARWAVEGSLFNDPGLIDEMRGPLTIVYMVALIAGITCTSLFGIPMAATAANAAEYSPKNDLIFGFGSFFFPQFVLSAIAVFLPGMLLSFFGAPLAGWFASGSFGSLAIGLIVLISVFVLISWCIPMSGMALGYKLTRERVVEERDSRSTPVFDHQEERENLKSLRAQRQKGAKGTSVYNPKG